MEMDGGCVAFVTINSQLCGFHQEVFVSGSKEGHLLVRNGDLYGRKDKANKEQVLYKAEKNEKDNENEVYLLNYEVNTIFQ